MIECPEPHLAPPGAGLPRIELAIARALFALRRWTGNRRGFDQRFEAERQRIRDLLEGVDPLSRGRRVLIRRLPGLEDSSRNWSIWMTLDHLRIVHREFHRVISALAEGVMPAGVASTALVKPGPDAGAGVVQEYEKSCDDLSATVDRIPNLQTPLRYAHPWFGPLDAAGWHALAAGHLSIHRRQMEAIRRGLNGSR